MKIFDIHTDILYDLYTNKVKGIDDRFDYHVNQLKDSAIKGGLWTMYSPNDFNLIESLECAINEIDINKLPNFKIILGLEGLRNLENIEDLDIIYGLGFRHAMITWNEENKYATGVSGDSNRGVTPLGKQLIRKMEALDMIIDVAHLNEKSFYEVLEITNKNIIFSHGNVKSICNHRRNLTDLQLKRLKEVNGLFGLTLASTFVNQDKDKQDLEHFLNHLEKAVLLMGVDNVVFGFDFMDYFDESQFSNISDVNNATYAYRIVEGMKNRGFNNQEIEKICWDNFYNRYKNKIHTG